MELWLVDRGGSRPVTQVVTPEGLIKFIVFCSALSLNKSDMSSQQGMDSVLAPCLFMFGALLTTDFSSVFGKVAAMDAKLLSE